MLKIAHGRPGFGAAGMDWARNTFATPPSKTPMAKTTRNGISGFTSSRVLVVEDVSAKQMNATPTPTIHAKKNASPLTPKRLLKKIISVARGAMRPTATRVFTTHDQLSANWSMIALLSFGWECAIEPL